MSRNFAIVTGASSGIGFELARIAAENGHDLLIAADRDLDAAATKLRALGVEVDAVEGDLATPEGVDRLLAAAGDRKVDALFANAGHGLGHAFLDQDFADIQHVVDTNITGTLYLIQKVVREMKARNAGRVLITGSIAGYMPGAFQAVYNGTKAFIDSFGWALANELKETEVTISILMPGATDTDFFDRAGMSDTSVATGKLDDPVKVAQDGYNAMMKGESEVVSGWKNKIQSSIANVTPAPVLAEMHRKMAEPGSGKR
ncbi:SDR family NAD(P)-dependent oxidoreductase [Sphingoaurantiacus capsulatus]|uniref:SDR family NAD(P)-dependent oxidoreductase n=1 Tax=Sphingoaurantiacus capsulatus TaxID=1771310 RepID=A0ABV7X767_9SPHN